MIPAAVTPGVIAEPSCERRNVAVLGATGSIGGSALDVIARHPDRYRASVLSANRDSAALAELCLRFQPDLAVMVDRVAARDLRERLRSANCAVEVADGADALVDAAASARADTVVAAIVGAAGLKSTLSAARAGKRLLLANKEAVVMAGDLLLAALADGGGQLLPIDSEHNAVFQCLPNGRKDVAGAGVRRIVLTASGGPFRGRRRVDLAAVTPAMACAHPNWRMGPKISVDSATLMNKGLEVIEAHILFGVPGSAIDVVVHPQSVIHSLVDYVDGSMLAQLGNPDMRTALAYALAWPQRIDAGVPALDLIALARLDFEPADSATFVCLSLAYHALAAGGNAPAVLNAGNEEAVAAFLDGRIGFLDISSVIERTLAATPSATVDDLDGLFDIDLTARRQAQRIIATLCQ